MPTDFLEMPKVLEGANGFIITLSLLQQEPSFFLPSAPARFCLPSLGLLGDVGKIQQSLENGPKISSLPALSSSYHRVLSSVHLSTTLHFMPWISS